MAKVTLGEVAMEARETCKGDRSGFPTVGLEHITPGEIRLSEYDVGSDNTFTKRFHEGDILFGRRRAYLKKAAIAPFEGICSGDITVIRAIQDKMEPRLLPFVIQNDDFFDFAVGRSAGSLSPRVKWEHLKTYSFELPEMDKQRELADVLWAIEDTRAAYQELAAAMEELVKSQFVELFGNPNEMDKWPCCKVEDIADVTVGLVIKPTRFYTENAENGIKAFRSLNVREMYINDSDWVYFSPEGNEQNKKSQLQKGDVLVVRSGYPGTSCVVTDEYVGCNAIDIMLARPKKDKINPYYLCAFNNFPHGMNQIRHGTGGAAQKHFNVGAYNKVNIPVPPLELQNSFVEFMQLADKSKLTIREILKKNAAMKLAILREYLK